LAAPATGKSRSAQNLAAARCVISAISDPYEAGALIEQARALNKNVRVLARASSPEAVAHLRHLGADVIVFSDDEIARRLIEEALGAAEPEQGRPPGASPIAPALPRADAFALGAEPVGAPRLAPTEGRG
jgi:hypothetical protein